MRRVLIVEDDIFLREMYVHTFEKHGYEVESAEDGQLGIDLANKDPFDIILLDIMLPKKNGVEVLKELRQPDAKAAKTPIILLSNLGQDSIISEAFTLGADGYILKADVLPNEVLDKIDGFLNGTLTREDFRYSRSIS